MEGFRKLLSLLESGREVSIGLFCDGVPGGDGTKYQWVADCHYWERRSGYIESHEPRWKDESFGIYNEGVELLFRELTSVQFTKKVNDRQRAALIIELRKKLNN